MKDPFSLFAQWFEEASKAGAKQVEAFALSTVGLDKKPKARFLLLKGVTEKKFIFFTNYLSPKSQQLAKHPYASMNFFWPEIFRQVRIEGKVKKVSRSESDAYWVTRPRESQIGAWASHQSSELSSFQELENRILELQKKFEGRDVPRPPHWGGFALDPDLFEFWLGRAYRIHEREVFTKKRGGWNIKLLSP